ncbi:MAG: M28 family peptidase, partial [Acidobacteriia bacterium]|nr:M28 family peptidase [Terriglobia bacterium]
MKTVFALSAVAIALFVPSETRAQPTAAERATLAKLDAARASAFLKYLSEDVVTTPSGAGAGTAVAGSSEEKALANAIEQEFKRAGLTVRQEPFPVRTYKYGPVTLTAGGKAIGAVSLHAAGGTWRTRYDVLYARGNEAGGHRVRATLVDAGDGYADDYARTGSVRGKAVLVRRGGGWPTYQILEAAHQGASALLIYDYPGARDDTLKQDSMWYHEQLPTVSVAKRDAVRLKNDLERGPVEVALENRVDSGDGISQNVVATIRGTELPDEWITATAHYDRWFHGAQDNSAGAASLVELARVFAGYRPRRSLMFIATGGEESGIEATESDWLAGSHAFVTAHPEVTRRLAFEFNLDGAGWPSQRGYLHATVDNVAFQRQILADLDLATRLDIRPNISSNVDAWNLGIVGGGAAAYVTWREARPDAPDLFGPIYHTQADVYDPAHFTNLIHDLKIGALGILRMDTAIALPIALTDVAAWVSQSLDSDAARARDVSFDAARRALAAFLNEAQRIDAARKRLT